MPFLNDREAGEVSRIQNIIFDLDGTLVDSLPGIGTSATYAVESVLPGRRVPDMRRVIGPPIATMFADLWPDLVPAEVATLVAAFRQRYDTVGCLQTEAYPGVAETLNRLSAAGLQMFVLTNKPLVPTRLILQHNRLSEYIREVVSPDSSDPPFRSKSEGAQALAVRHALQPAQTVVIGDGDDDASAADACGFHFIAARYGYGRIAAEGREGAPSIKSFFEIESLVLRSIRA